jgi:hypothetical protein
MLVDGDAGDEHRDPPPRELDEITKLLIEFGDWPGRIDTVSEYWEVQRLVMHAESVRDCCAECSRDARGVEDGA